MTQSPGDNVSQQVADLAHTGEAPPIPIAPTAPIPTLEPTTRAAPVHPGIDSGLGLKKFRDPLSIPPVIQLDADAGPETIRIAARPAQARIHADLPPTPVWAYEGDFPGPTIDVHRGVPARIDWVNELADADGGAAHLPYDVVRVPPPVRDGSGGAPPIPDGRLAADFAEALWPGGHSGDFSPADAAYPPLPFTADLTGWTAVHLHGALTNGHNDGWADNVGAPGDTTRATYPNDQQATGLWYHDHAMAVTRFNVPAGLVGAYLIRDDNERGLGLPSGEHEIPLLIADRNLESSARIAPGAEPSYTGRILYKQAGFTISQADAEAGNIGEIPVTGPFTIVNGTIWPLLRVAPRWYRFRIVNTASSRVLKLALHDTTDEVLTPGVGIPATVAGGADNPAFVANRKAALVVIGTDSGLLPAPVGPLAAIELGPAERLDVLIDFGAFRDRTLELRNGSGSVLNAQPGQAEASIMQFVVDRQPAGPAQPPPAVLNPAYNRYQHLPNGDLQVGDRIIHEHEHAWIGLIPTQVRGGLHPELWELAVIPEGESLPDQDLIRVTGADGTITSLRPMAKLFDDATTIVLPRDSWAVWHFLHLGGPAHPMHIHMTSFQMIARRAWPLDPATGNVAGFDLATGVTTVPLPAPGAGLPIDPVTAGMKDTWVVRPGEWISVLGEFAGAAGSFMYHCHILDHEDHTMMRPYVVLPSDILHFHRAHGGGHQHADPSTPDAGTPADSVVGWIRSAIGALIARVRAWVGS